MRGHKVFLGASKSVMRAEQLITLEQANFIIYTGVVKIAVCASNCVVHRSTDCAESVEYIKELTMVKM